MNQTVRLCHLLLWTRDPVSLSVKAGNPINRVPIKVKVFVAQAGLTVWDPMDCSFPGSSVHGVLQARILEWVAMPFSRGSSNSGIKPWSACTAGRFFTV